MTSVTSRLRRLAGQRPPWRNAIERGRARVTHLLDTAPRRASYWAAGGAALVAVVTAGPVAAVIAAVYCGLSVLVLARHRAARVRQRDRAATRHAVALLAADLRAGSEPAATIAAVPFPESDDPVCRRSRDRLTAACRIADTVGAPISRLLDQLAADLRAEARVDATLSTHTAGTLASGRLLAALPIVGLGFGQALGAEPVATLLYTPVGAGCVALAMALQLAGLAWSRRILSAATAGAVS